VSLKITTDLKDLKHRDKFAPIVLKKWQIKLMIYVL